MERRDSACFPKDYTFEVRYLGTRGIHLPAQVRLNRTSPVTLTNQLPTYLTAPTRPNSTRSRSL